MNAKDPDSGSVEPGQLNIKLKSLRARLAAFPWWLVAILSLIFGTFYLIFSQPTFADAFSVIRTGLSITISSTFIAYCVALTLGLVAGLGRVSKNPLANNISTLYVELVRGIPLLVLIFFIALVLVPAGAKLVSTFGQWLVQVGLTGIGASLASIDNRAIPMNFRAVVSLSLTYGAFSAEVFRAGIQSVGHGQMEAARSQGMSYSQAMRHIILPQAVRNVLPAIGNDFISMLKDSSLVSVLAVRDITQVARLYSGRTFNYPEAYTILSVLYLSMTILLSFGVKLIERRLNTHVRKS